MYVCAAIYLKALLTSWVISMIVLVYVMAGKEYCWSWESRRTSGNCFQNNRDNDCSTRAEQF